MKRLLLVFIILFVCNACFALNLEMKNNFDLKYTGRLVSCDYDFNDNAYVAVGSFNRYARIIKFDNNDNVLWKRNFGGNDISSFNSVTYDSNYKAYVAVGRSEDDAIIVKFDVNGNVLWGRSFGGDGYDFFNSVTYDHSENTYVAVGFSSASSFGNGDWDKISGKGEEDAIIVKFDINGNVLWKKNFGGYDYDKFNRVIHDPYDDSYVAVGDSSNYAIIVKFNFNGNVLWKKDFVRNKDYNFNSITFDPNNADYILVGYSNVISNSCSLIIRLDSLGNILFEKGFGGPFNSVTYDDRDNSYIAVGYGDNSSFGKENRDAIIVKFDDNGNVLSNSYFGGKGSDGFQGIIYDIMNNDYVAIGYSDASSFGNGDWIGVAKKSDDYDLITVRFKYVAIAGITVDPTSLDLNVGDSSKLSTTVLPEDASNKNVVWSSNDTNVATVDTSGNVTAVANGVTTITVTTEAGNKTASCTVTVTTPVIPVTSVVVAPTSLNLNLGDSSTLSATVLPSNASNKNIIWSSINESVATVDSSGKVTAKANGLAIITATTNNNKTATCKVTVTTSITDIVINPTSLFLNIGDSSKLSATVLPVTASNKNIIWLSGNEDIATVDSNGKVTAKANGSTIIIATTEDGTKAGTCTVVVTTPATGITINPKSLSLNIGFSSSLIATVSPVAASNKNISWKSSNTSIATVDENGVVTGKAKGSATITATTVDGNKKATCNVTVTIPVASITVDPTSLSLGVGSNVTLKATVLPTNAANKKVTWVSSNSSIATVDANGKVIAKSKGSVTITATTVDGGKTATCAIKVITPITSITITPKTLSLGIGSSSVLVATVLPANASDKSVTWTSSNTNIATVDVNGKVTARAKGNATITAFSVDGKKKATCSLTVTIPVASVTITPNTLALGLGKTGTLSATVLPTTAANKKVTWKSSNLNIATVDVNGKVTGKTKGTAVVTVTTVDGNKIATCNVAVVTLVTGVAIVPNTVTLDVNSSITLSATISPMDAYNKNVTWSSSNKKVATVDLNGRVLTFAKGSATITAITVDGNKKATCKVTVK